ncbi:MAG: hypothetical protein Q9204_007975, partial [Flavoplaca sp. TL-2023a]
MYGDKPLVAEGVISNAKLFDDFAAHGYYSTNVMLLLTAITDTKASTFQFVDDGTHRCTTPPPRCPAKLTSIIVVSFSKIAESDPIGHWITVHANVAEKLIRIYDSMDIQARQLTSEEELPTAYLQPIKLIRETFPFITALGVDRRIFLTQTVMPSDGTSCGPLAWRQVEALLEKPLDNPETIETIRLRHCTQALEALELLGEVVQPTTSDELELQSDGSRNRKRLAQSNATPQPLYSKRLRRSSSSITTKSYKPDLASVTRSDSTHTLNSGAFEASNDMMDDDDDDDDGDAFDPLSINSNTDSDEENPNIDAGGTPVKIPAGPQISGQNHKTTWTSEEDKLVVEKRNAGLSWSHIGQHFRYRTKQAVQARFYELEKKAYQETVLHKNAKRPRNLAPPKSDRFRACTSRASKLPYIFTLWTVDHRTDWTVCGNRQHCTVEFVDCPEGHKLSKHLRQTHSVTDIAGTTEHQLEKMNLSDKTIAINSTMRLVAVGDFCHAEWLGPSLVWWEFEGRDNGLNNLPTLWIELEDALRLLGVAGPIRPEIHNFLAYDRNGNKRDLYRNILPPFQDDDRLLMCGLCNYGFASHELDQYYYHAAAHYRGVTGVTPCCLQPDATTGRKKEHTTLKPFCRPHPTPQRHGPFADLIKQLHTPVADSSWIAEQIEHKWEVVAISVRYSGKNQKAEVEKKMEELRTRYMKSFTPEVKEFVNMPQSVNGRSSCEPPWIFPGTRWSERNAAEATALFIHSQVKEGGSILLLCLGIDGLSSNLQWLMHLPADFSPGVITLGLCTSKKVQSREVARENKKGML